MTDDSGSDNQGPVFVLAGYVSDEDRWKIFSEEWVKALQSGPRPLEYFKMVEAHSKKGQFLGWNSSDRDAKLIELDAIIQNHVMFDVRIILWWKDYQDVQSRYPQYPLSPYEILLHHVMIKAILHIRNCQIRDIIDFYFDEQNRIGDTTLKEYRRQESTLPPLLLQYVAGPPQFRNEKQVLPLQAADLLAWQVRRSIYEIENPDRRDQRISLPCLERVPSRPWNLDKEELEDTYAAIEPWMNGN